MYIKRFSIFDRVSHIFLILTFLIQSATGFSRLFITTAWGKQLSNLFGGYESCGLIHRRAGMIMVAGFLVHIIYLLTRINWQNLGESLFGPDSLIPNLDDVRHIWQRILWTFGFGSPPELNRWAYWEKFDYWAVFWGMPLLAATGLMLIYPIISSRYVPGWSLNVAALLHKAEAILAVTYIFIVHFFVGHLRPTCFPMNEVMFSGGLPLEEVLEEKPAWVARLKDEGKLGGLPLEEALEDKGKLEPATANPPALWFRVVYFVFGYGALGFGLYMLINGLIYSQYVTLH
jgi:cytochrome b subunit of formate dehydrogenase